MKVREGKPIESLLTPAEVAQALKVSAKTARRIMREDGGTVRVGKLLRWTQTKLERFIRNGGSRTPTAYHKPPDADPHREADDATARVDELFPPIAPRARRKTSPEKSQAADASNLFLPITPRVRRKKTNEES